MKNSMIMASLVLAAAAGAAQAGTIHAFYTPFQTGQGGEFRIVGSLAGMTNQFSDITGTGNYRGTDLPATGANRRFDRATKDFQTFCIERRENISNDTVYQFSIDAGAVNGGWGGGNPDLIGNETAYLYRSFRLGSLSNYNYGGINAAGFDTLANGSQNTAETNREASARTLQTAIWFLEQELRDASNVVLTGSNLPLWSGSLPSETNPNGLNQTQWNQARQWITDAQNATAGYAANAYAQIVGVRALNLWQDRAGPGRVAGRYDVGDTLAQSQLTLIPLPTGAALGLAGLSVLAIRRRAAR